MKKNGSAPLGLYTIGIAALFLAGFFMLVFFGAQSYRNTVAAQDSNMDTRALLAYFGTAVKANDAEGSLRIEESAPGADGQVLVLSDVNTGYDVRIYKAGGSLVEDYAEAGSPLDPEFANTIAAAEVFEVRFLKDEKLLEIDTDAGTVRVAARCCGGEAE